MPQHERNSIFKCKHSIHDHRGLENITTQCSSRHLPLLINHTVSWTKIRRLLVPVSIMYQPVGLPKIRRKEAAKVALAGKRQVHPKLINSLVDRFWCYKQRSTGHWVAVWYHKHIDYALKCNTDILNFPGEHAPGLTQDMLVVP